MNHEDKDTEKYKNEHNRVLKYLDEKNIGEWTKEDTIEKHFDGLANNRIAPYTIRTILQVEVVEGNLDHSRNMNEYKITSKGKTFVYNGGYK